MRWLFDNGQSGLKSEMVETFILGLGLSDVFMVHSSLGSVLDLIKVKCQVST